MLGELFNVGDTITFNVYPANIIGAEFSNVLVLGVLDGDTMRLLGQDPVAMHARVYPTLPAGTTNNAMAYSYLKLQTPTRNIVYIGIPWIVRDTVTLTNEVDIVVRIRRRKATDVAIVQQALSSNGIGLDADSIKIEQGTQAPA